MSCHIRYSPILFNTIIPRDCCLSCVMNIIMPCMYMLLEEYILLLYSTTSYIVRICILQSYIYSWRCCLTHVGINWPIGSIAMHKGSTLNRPWLPDLMHAHQLYRYWYSVHNLDFLNCKLYIQYVTMLLEMLWRQNNWNDVITYEVQLIKLCF